MLAMCNLLGKSTTTFQSDIMSHMRLQVVALYPARSSPSSLLPSLYLSLSPASQNILQVTVISRLGYRLSCKLHSVPVSFSTSFTTDAAAFFSVRVVVVVAVVVI